MRSESEEAAKKFEPEINKMRQQDLNGELRIENEGRVREKERAQLKVRKEIVHPGTAASCKV